MSLEQLQAEVAECTVLLEQAKSARVRNVLTRAQAEAQREITNLEIKARLDAERKAGPNAKRYLHELTDYGWDQSASFVKIFVTLAGVQNCPEEAVTVSYTTQSLELHVSDLNGKDYGLTVNNLLHAINIEKSYRKIKTDMIVIYLKKSLESETWDVLTSIQKRIKQKQDKAVSKSTEDPETGLVNIMKKMYDSGDAKTKQMIAKAWTESLEMKAGRGRDPSSLEKN